MVNFQAGAGEPVGVQPVPLDTDYAKRKDYEENAYTVAEGKRLFSAFNCTGCHAHGGGDSGPPLMDDKWIYGSEPEQIFATLVEGRPNGMPSFGGRLPAYQLWQLTAYVRSLSGLVPSDAAPGRDDDLQGPPSEQSRQSEKPKDATPSKSTEMPE
jgi:cytochrome c oxidase cbb3-type subunit 3